LKTDAHVGRADMGREAMAMPIWDELQSRTKSIVVQSYLTKSPLLACPAGAEVLQLTPYTYEEYGVEPTLWQDVPDD